MTKEKAIEQLEWYFVEDNGISADLVTKQAFNIIKKALPQEPKWIPVSERLPENGTYLITRKNIINTPIVSICSFAKNLYLIDDFDFYDKKGKSGWYDYDGEIGYCEVDGIIAWMPLPKPYNKPQKKDICEKCSYAEETDGSHCYECVKGESKFKPQEGNV